VTVLGTVRWKESVRSQFHDAMSLNGGPEAQQLLAAVARLPKPRGISPERTMFCGSLAVLQALGT
jgi:hypothetical protein